MAIRVVAPGDFNREAVMDQRLMDLYHRHVGMAFDRQMRLADFLEREAGGQQWHYTISTAALKFGDRIEFEALDLGSHAAPDNSWLWAWNNPHLKLTAANRELANKVRGLARSTGVQAFAAERQVPCEELLGDEVSQEASHVFASIIAGELGYDAYFTIPFEHGKAAVVIRDKRFSVTEEHPISRIRSTFLDAICAFPIPDQKAAFLAYLDAYQVPAEIHTQVVRVTRDGVELLSATFNGENLLDELVAKVQPED